MWDLLRDRTIRSIFFKVVLYLAVLGFLDVLIPRLFGSLSALFGTVFVLTAVTTVLESWFLRSLHNIPTLILEYVAIAFVVWVIPGMFRSAHMHVWDAMVITTVILPFEYWIHRYVLFTERA